MGINKRASLSLSVNAIVVIVIAFVVLGLALTLTRTVFKEGMGKIPEAIILTVLESEPTAEKPIIVSDTIEIKRGGSKTLNMGFYNSDVNAHKTTLEVGECLDADGKKVCDETTLPEECKIPHLAAVTQSVEPSSATGFKVIMKEKGLTGGNRYICTLSAVSKDAEGNKIILETEQFYLYVTT